MRKQGIDLPFARLGVEQVTTTELLAKLELARTAGERSGRGNKRNVQILELRLAGHRPTAIAAMLGLKVDRIKSAMSDPDGSKRKAAGYDRKGTCEVCGEPTKSRTSVADPSRPHKHRTVAAPARLCDRHAREQRWGRPLLTREYVIEQLKVMARHLDRTPKIKDFSGPDAPFSCGVFYGPMFGKNGFTVALREAGLLAREARGQDRHDDKATEITWQQRATVLRLGGSLEFDGETVHPVGPAEQPRRNAA